jgi:hypothetical protein
MLAGCCLGACLTTTVKKESGNYFADALSGSEEKLIGPPAQNLQRRTVSACDVNVTRHCRMVRSSFNDQIVKPRRIHTSHARSPTNRSRAANSRPHSSPCQLIGEKSIVDVRRDSAESSRHFPSGSRPLTERKTQINVHLAVAECLFYRYSRSV